MIEIIKNMFRRKLRTILTIFGITIGVFALVVMGAMAEKMTLLVDGGTKYYKNKVSVSEGDYATGSFMSVPMTTDKIAELERFDGVKLASGSIVLTLDKELGAVQMGPPAMIGGGDLKGEEIDRQEFNIGYSRGRALTNEDKGKAVVGSDLVKKLNADIGKEITVRDRKFEVIGITEKTFTMPDTTVTLTLDDAQDLFYETLPEIMKQRVDKSKIINGITVYAADGTSADDLAAKIEKDMKDVKATGPKKFQDQIASAVAIFNTIIFGIGLISLLVGGLSVINTMVMSIAERTKEIGVKKAIGAKTRNVMVEYLTEAGVIGLFGGVLGLGFGALFTFMVNSYLEQSGDRLFLVTGRLAFGSVAFAVVLGVVAGLYPAYHAAKLNIVKALREE